MKTRFAAALTAALSLVACEREVSPLTPIKRSQVKHVPAPAIAPARQLLGLRAAYRLHPDRRFLMAFGELRRLNTKPPRALAAPAAASFVDARWTVEVDGAIVGSLPEFPDFPDYWTLLVAQAKSQFRPSPPTSAAFSPDDGSLFLMPGILNVLASDEAGGWTKGALRQTARDFTRISFQMPDALELAPLIPARALALLAAARASDAGSGLEDEALLAHSLGYTRHAQAVARSLPKSSPVRLYEESRGDELQAMAARPGASEETRYLALKLATTAGDLRRWQQLRIRLFPQTESPSVVATAYELALPQQMEVEDFQGQLAAYLPFAVAAELTGAATASRNAPVAPFDLDAAVIKASERAKGDVWDSAAVRSYYQAIYHQPWIYYATFSEKYWPREASTRVGTELLRLLKGQTQNARSGADRAGGEIRIEATRRRTGDLPGYPEIALEVRSLVPYLDSRPSHRAQFARFSHENLLDIQAAESLHLSLLAVLGDQDRKQKALSALYVGDWTQVERLLEGPGLSAPEASGILWQWHLSRAEPDGLDRQFRRAMARFRADWSLASYYVDFLRSRKQYAESCRIGEAWLLENQDSRTPGFFHAHIRLAHSYLLAHEFDKGRRLLEAVRADGPMQQSFVNRGIAECLAGSGRLTEAETLMREALRVNRGDPNDQRDLVKILWAEGKDDQAAHILGDSSSGLSPWSLCDALSNDLYETFASVPAERLSRAVASLSRESSLRLRADCVPKAFAAAGRFEDAVRISRELEGPGPATTDTLLVPYEYLKGWKGREAAAAWLKPRIPPARLNGLGTRALYTENYDLLWDVVVTPTADAQEEWIWVARACASLLRGDLPDPHGTDLLVYYQREIPGPFHVLGRYLLGLASEDEISALTNSSERTSLIAYGMAVRAIHEKRIRPAFDWYRLAADTTASSDFRTLAIYALGKSAGTGQGIWRLEKAASPAALVAPTSHSGTHPD